MCFIGRVEFVFLMYMFFRSLKIVEVFFGSYYFFCMVKNEDEFKCEIFNSWFFFFNVLELMNCSVVIDFLGFFGIVEKLIVCFLIWYCFYDKKSF